MLACGAVCQPNEIIREIELFMSSTSPAKVATDTGEGFVKSLCNPMGDAALISELVAGELAAWFGLGVPPFAIIRKCDIEIIMRKNGQIMQPPLFFSSSVDGIARDGTNTFLSRLVDTGDVAKLVVFDTWIRNWDRYFDGEANSENLLYVRISRRKYKLTPIDHSNCFIGAAAEFPDNAPPDWVEDPNVYGKFPEFDEFISNGAVAAALAKLATLERARVVEVVNSVPLEWGLSQQARAGLVNFICDRAAYVVNTLAARLVDEPELPGLMVQ